MSLSGARFKNLSILNLALSHRSYVNEAQDSRDNNERLEFLGDSVLGLVVSSYLVQHLPDRPEGELAKIKSFVVSEGILSVLAKAWGLDSLLLIGKGEENSGGRNKKALLADALEAVFGAYYLDAGFEEAEKLVLGLLKPQIALVLEDRHQKDYKTLLQELVQKDFRTYPKYTLTDRVGPDHDRTFYMDVSVEGRVLGSGSGKNKKEAEQVAAGIAYEAITGTSGTKEGPSVR
ncbi:MAG: ribonuclease III [Spirochaetales bacterium]